MRIIKTAPERTGWRDEKISRRHREWGVDCCATDLDFLLLEYSSCEGGEVKLSALIEYKHQNAKVQNSGAPQYKALRLLCNPANLPLFAVRYADDFSSFTVVPLNRHALKYLAEISTLSETEYVTLLYQLRGHKEMPKKILELILADKSEAHHA